MTFQNKFIAVQVIFLFWGFFLLCRIDLDKVELGNKGEKTLKLFAFYEHYLSKNVTFEFTCYCFFNPFQTELIVVVKRSPR